MPCAVYCGGVYRLEMIKIYSRSLFDGDDLLVIKTVMDEQEVTVYSQQRLLLNRLGHDGDRKQKLYKQCFAFA